MLILDANVWIGLFNVEDSQHKKAKNIFAEINGEILIPEYILVEVLNVLTEKASKKHADKFLSMVVAGDEIEIGFSSKDFLFRVIQQFLMHEGKKLSFIDQSLLYLSQFHKVITFDKHLAKQL
jgi:predicted nucleic acid-binding protein